MYLDVMSREVDMLYRMFDAAGVDVQEVKVLKMSGAESLAVFNGKGFFIRVQMRSKSPTGRSDDRDVLELFERTEVPCSEDGKEGK